MAAFFLAEGTGEQRVLVSGQCQSPAGLQHRMEAGNGGGAGVRAGNVFQDLTRHDAVERARGERQAAQVGLNKMDVRDPAREQLATVDAQGLEREVYRHHLADSGRQNAGHAARAAAGFQQAVGRKRAQGAKRQGDFDAAEVVQERHGVIVADLGVPRGDLGLLGIRQGQRQQAGDAVLNREHVPGIIGQAAVGDVLAFSLAHGEGEWAARFGRS